MAVLTPNDEVRKFLNQQHASVIDGSPVAEGQPHPVIDPATEATIAQVLFADAGTVDKAVQSAHRAFRDGRWTGLRPADRERILLDFASKVAEHAETLAQIESLNQGKSIHVARMIDAGGSVEFMRYMAGWATKIEGRTMDVSIAMPPGSRHTAYTRREPVGVVAGIVPWNFPLLIATWKLIPALAAGCTVVLKPSPETPLTALYLAQLALQAGIPPGVFNLVPGGVETGQALVAHPLVRKITLVGGVPTGKAVMRAAADDLKPVLLELGGKNALIAYPDADEDRLVNGIIAGMNFTWSGQRCGSTRRVFLHESLHDRVLEKVARLLPERHRPGIPTDPRTTMGSLVSRAQLEKVQGYVASALAEGARLVTGGRQPDDPALQGGFFYEPTVFAGMRPDMKLACEEVFGPVMSVFQWSDEQALFEAVNAVPFGLTGSIWTRDLNTAHRAARRIQTGYVWINNVSQHFVGAPFGGIKQSGIGREECFAELLEFTQTKNVNVKF